MRLIPALLLVLAASPSFGLSYPCPSDPGFCYFDVGNDGCFDSPADTGPITADLEAGIYPDPGPPVAGSIVCPPSVKKLNALAKIEWSTATGGDILMYDVKIKASGVDCDAGGELHFDGKIISGGGLFLRADGDVSIDGRFVAKDGQLYIESINGSMALADRTNIKARNTVWVRTYNDGDIVVGNKSKLKSKDGAPSIISEGDATTSNVFMQGGGGVSIRGDNITMVGRSTMQALRDDDYGHVSINTNLGEVGKVEIDWLIASGRGAFINVGSFALGLPINGEVKKSKIKSSRGNIFIDADGPITLDRVTMTTPKEWLGPRGVDLETEGTQLDLLSSSVRGGFFRLETAPGGTCDITGTTWTNVTPTFNCDTVVGP